MGFQNDLVPVQGVSQHKHHSRCFAVHKFYQSWNWFWRFVQLFHQFIIILGRNQDCFGWVRSFAPELFKFPLIIHIQNSLIKRIPEVPVSLMVVHSPVRMIGKTEPIPETGVPKILIGDYPLVYECWEVHFKTSSTSTAS